MKEIIIPIVILLVLLFLVISYMNNKRIVIQNYQIISIKIPKSFHGVKLAVLSDLHGYRFGKEQEKLLEKLQSINPDYIMLAGDMLTADVWTGIKKKTIYHNLAFLKQLAEKFPVYYAPGNHEHKFEERSKDNGVNYQKFVEKLQDYGIIYLENEAATITREDEEITVWGLKTELEYYTKIWNRKKLSVEHIDELLSQPDADGFSILLAHNPEYYQAYISWGANLVFSGHLHGGIIRFPRLGGLISPTWELFPRTDGGAYQIGDLVVTKPCTRKEKGETNGVMVLSKGLGTHTINTRLGNPPELVVVELQSGVAKVR